MRELSAVATDGTYTAEACRRCALSPARAHKIGYCMACWRHIESAMGPGICSAALIHEFAETYLPFGSGDVHGPDRPPEDLMFSSGPRR